MPCSYDWDERLAEIDDDEPSWAERSMSAAASASPRSSSKQSSRKKQESKDKKAVEEAEKSFKK